MNAPHHELPDPATPQPDAFALPEVDDAFADPTLIRAMLALTPEQRLERLQAHVDALWELGLGDPAALR